MGLITSSLPPDLEPCGRSAFTVKFLCVEKGQKQVQNRAGRAEQWEGQRAEQRADWPKPLDGRGLLSGVYILQARVFLTAPEATGVTEFPD